MCKFAANRGCGNLQIYCPKNNKCLNKSLQCDGKKDCDDWSDEAHCGKRDARACHTHHTALPFVHLSLTVNNLQIFLGHYAVKSIYL